MNGHELIETTASDMMKQFADLVESNRAAVGEIAVMMRIMAERLATVEREIRFLRPVSGAQARELNRLLRERAQALLARKDAADADSVNAVCRLIRKDIKLRWGVKTVSEIPKVEYDTAVSMIGLWDDTIEVRKIIRKAREQNAGSCENGDAPEADARR